MVIGMAFLFPSFLDGFLIYNNIFYRKIYCEPICSEHAIAKVSVPCWTGDVYNSPKRETQSDHGDSNPFIENRKNITYNKIM